MLLRNRRSSRQALVVHTEYHKHDHDDVYKLELFSSTEYIYAMSLGREKALPNIPIDIDYRTALEHEDPARLNTSKNLSSESEGEMRWLHELWNEAGLSAVSAILDFYAAISANS